VGRLDRHVLEVVPEEGVRGRGELAQTVVAERSRGGLPRQGPTAQEDRGGGAVAAQADDVRLLEVRLGDDR